MRNKTLTLITAILITSAVLILTISLSLLNSSAIDGENGFFSSLFTSEDVEEAASEPNVPAEPDEGPVTDEEIFVDPNAPTEPEVEDPTLDVPEVNEPAIEDETATEDDTIIEEDTVFVPEIGPLGNPVFPATEEWDGSEVVEGHSAPTYIDDVVIAIYEHATGKRVGQVTIRDDEAWKTVNQLHLDIYEKGNCIYDPSEIDSVPVCIPNGKYRIEVYAIWWADDGGCGSLFFAYTYGDNEMIEMWKHGIVYSGAEEFIAYTDSLIADEMAAIEAGTNVVPSPEEAITYICGFGADMPTRHSFRWTGDYHATFESSRGTPRFPYLEIE